MAVTTLMASTPVFAGPGQAALMAPAAMGAPLQCGPAPLTADERAQFDQFILKSSKAIASKTGNAELVYERGLARVAKGENEEAYKDFDEAIRLNYRTADAYFNRGAAAYESKTKHPAKQIQKDFMRAIELDPQHAEAYFFLGTMTAEKQSYAAAIILYAKALEIDPGYSDVYAWRADAYSAIGDNENAVRDFERYIQANPSDACTQLDLARTQDSMGQTGKAETQYNKTISTFPKFAPAYLGRGEFYARHGQSAKAMRDFNQSISIHPTIRSYTMRSKAHLKAGQPFQASRDMILAMQKGYFKSFKSS